MSRALAFFNNKGGVGKTTLSCNIASQLAAAHDWSILFVDCDPQCNATQLLLAEETWTKLYSNRRESTGLTVLKALRHIRIGNSDVDADVAVHSSERFGVDVLAGHPQLATYEDRFSSAWLDLKGGDLGAVRRSLWARYLADALEYDLIIFDVGPSLGALNRCVLLGVDYFLTPMEADLFSLYALDNIGEWITDWFGGYTSAVAELDSSDREELSIPDEPALGRGYLGYTIQQYVSRRADGLSRPIRAYDQYVAQVPKRAESLSRFTDPALELDIGVVPHMFSMVPMAQQAHAPIAKLATEDGLRGAQFSQRDAYVEQLEQLSRRVFENLTAAGI